MAIAPTNDRDFFLNRIIETPVALTPGATVTLDGSLANHYTLTPAQTCTINATNLQNGRSLSLEVVTSGTNSYTITFGTNFKSAGTLATGTVTAKTFLVYFWDDGAAIIETVRSGPDGAGGSGSGSVTNVATTAPITGGPITTTGTLGLAITTTNDGGAVVKQASTPGTAQTGHSNITGTMIAGNATISGSAVGSLGATVQNTSANAVAYGQFQASDDLGTHGIRMQITSSGAAPASVASIGAFGVGVDLNLSTIFGTSAVINAATGLFQVGTKPGAASDISTVFGVGRSVGGEAVIATIANTHALTTGDTAGLSFTFDTNLSARAIIRAVVENSVDASTGLGFSTFNSGVAEHVRLRGDGRLGVGIHSPFYTGHFVGQPGATIGGVIIEQETADTVGPVQYFWKGRGTVDTPVQPTTGDTLGSINFAGYGSGGGTTTTLDARTYITGAQIRVDSTGTIAPTRVAGVIRFLTGTDAAPTVLTEAMRIDQLQRVGIGMTPARALDVTGTFGATGAATLGSTLAVTGNATFSSQVGINIAPASAQLYIAHAASALNAIRMRNTDSANKEWHFSGSGNDFVLAESGVAIVQTWKAGGNVGVGMAPTGANGLLQVNGSIGLSGARQIRPASNADTDTLQLFATSIVVGALNSTAYGYSGGGLLAAVTGNALAVVFDAGGAAAATAHRLKVTNDGTGVTGKLFYGTPTLTVISADSATGNVGFGTTAPAGVLHAAADLGIASQTGPGIFGSLATLAKRVVIGYDTTNDYGFINAVNSGTAWKGLQLAGNASVSVIIGTAARSTTDVDGFLYIPTCAGTPTGVPTAHTGTVPIIYDTTGTKLWIYRGGAWAGVVI